MKLIKDTFKRIVLIIVLISILITYLATPAAYAKLDLEEGEYYYSGTTKGTYVPSENIFSWLINALAQVADFILGILSLIIRMPFVGWTALLEKMLTWALESTMGVSADGSMIGTTVNDDGEIEVNSSDLTGLTNSSNNVTVEAIVYNRVAALDIDVFDTEFDRTLSATGQKLVCRKCEKQVAESGSGLEEYISKPVDECMDTEAIKAIIETAKANGTEPEIPECDCECGGCDACEFYVAQLKQEEPLIFVLKRLVATWYTIIRLLAIAAMLLVLLGIGIKMAISTIASDKAVYKRMLVDWVVGFLLLFGIHYFMIFVIQVNEVMVNTISESAQSINKVQMRQLGLTEAQYTDSDLELKIYEEVRTRAYDAKLSNGMIGMVMYMTLVYLAFRYTIIYLKRFLTIVVLTLMAPAIGVAYALQKALSGKSAALKTWMTEYIMNVIIQTVHALIYSIFISQALIMSLQNVSGMIMALVLMNYTSKADELFKKIFKFGGGDSLLGHTEGAADSFKQNMDAVMGFAAGAKPVAQALTNTPYGKVVKGMGKAALAGGVAVVGKLYTHGYNRSIDKELRDNPAKYEGIKDPSGDDEKTLELRRLAAKAAVDERLQQSDLEPDEQALVETGGHELKDRVENTTTKLKAEGDKPTEQTKKDNLKAKKDLNKFKQLTAPSTRKIMKGHFLRLISMENVFKAGKPDDSNGFTRALKTAWIATMGTSYYDKRQGKRVYDGNSVFDQFRASELLGLTDKDKKLLKDFGGDMMSGLIGMGSLFVGMGTIVANPKVGMALLAKGAASTSKVFGRDTDISRIPGKYYTFNRFNASSVDSIRQYAIAKAAKEGDEMLVAELTKRHPTLVKQLRDGIASGVTIGTMGTGALVFTTGIGTAAAAALPATAVTAGAAVLGAKFMRNSALSGKLVEIEKHHAKQQKELINKFNKEADKEELNSMKATSDYLDGRLASQVDEEYEKKRKEETEAEIEKKLREAGHTGEGEDERITVKGTEISGDEIKLTEKAKLKGYTDDDAKAYLAKTLDTELEKIILKMTAKDTIDITSKAVQDEIMKKLGTRLAEIGILEKNEKAASLIDGGEGALLRKVKIKTAVRNKVVSDAKQKLQEELDEETAQSVQAIVSDILQSTGEKENDKKISDITVDDVIAKMQPRSQDGSQRVNENDGSGRVTNPDEPQQVDENTRVAIEAYLNSVKAASILTPTELTGADTSYAVDEIKAQANRSFDSKKKKNRKSVQNKLKQVLSATIEDTGMIGEDGKIKVDEDGKVSFTTIDSTGREKRVEEILSSDELAYANATLKNLLQMKELNQKVLRRDVDMKKDGSPAYIRAMRANSEDRIGISRNMRKIAQGELELREPEGNRRPTTEITQEINNLRANIQTQENRIKARNERLSLDGPMQDIDAYIQKSLFKTVERR